MQGKFAFWIKLLSCLAVGLAISSFFITVGEGGEAIPLYKEVLGLLFVILTGASLLLINSKVLSNQFYPPLTVVLFLIITLINPASIYFSSVHVALLLFVLGQYCFVVNQKFTAMLLLGCSALFYAPFLWLLPVVVIFSLIGSPDFFRTAVKSIGGCILPLFYFLIFRYVAYNDAMEYTQVYMDKLLLFKTPFHLLNGTSFFFILTLGVITLYAITHILKKMHSVNIMAYRILKMEFMSLILAVAVFVLFAGEEAVPLNMIFALPLAIILSNYFTRTIAEKYTRVMLIILSCSVVLSRLSYFV